MSYAFDRVPSARLGVHARSSYLVALLCAALLGCGGGSGTDAGTDPTDGGGGPTDSGGSGTCGDGTVDPGEQCDDGNESAFDGCEPTVCTFTCTEDAQCDDGSECAVSTCRVCADASCTGGGGCMRTSLEDGTSCTAGSAAGVCRLGQCVEDGCGNEIVEDGESCDDGNDVARDGCENDCRFTCEVDPSMPNTWYLDCDGDGFAAQDPDPRTQCLEPAADTCGGGWTLRLPVTGASDCDDTRMDVYPGATEVCDLVDNNCAAGADEGLGSPFYADDDGDGHGNADAATTACTMPEGYVTSSDDCNDADEASYPGATEVCDGADNDCNESIDDGLLVPYYADADGDGYGNGTLSMQSCMPLSGHVTNNTDCNDSDPSMYPGNAESCDQKDNDCDGSVDDGVLPTWYRDADGDTYGTTSVPTVQQCTQPFGYVSRAGDCCDFDIRAFPGATEFYGTPRDSRCGGFDYNCDAVETQYDTNCQTACSEFADYPAAATDCAAEASGWLTGCRFDTVACRFSGGCAPPCGTMNEHGSGCRWNGTACENIPVSCSGCTPGVLPTQRCR